MSDAIKAGAIIAATAIGVGAIGGGDGHGPTSWTPEAWRDVVAPYASAFDLPLDFCIAWIRVESGGNPCAIGTPGAHGPDGNPRELGIAQLYNPDDFKALGIDATSLRAYCARDTGACARGLSADEMDAHARANVRLMARCRDRAETVLDTNGCGDWPTFDRACSWKLVHGLPGILMQGLPRVRAHLGRSPASWHEFRVTIDDVTLDGGTEAYRGSFSRVFANAENTAGSLR